MHKNPEEYLKHILDEYVFINSVFKTYISLSKYVADETLKRATVRSLEIIGEASKKIPADYKINHPQIQWKNMAGMRDRLIHDYMGINYFIVGMF